MAESFSEIGKIQAIEQLYRLSAYNPVSGLSYTSSKGGRITTASRMYLEGIDFNLVYFPLKHLGYKCVVGVTGELYAALAAPKTSECGAGSIGQTGFPAGQRPLDGNNDIKALDGQSKP